MYRVVLCLVLCLSVFVQGAIKDCGSKIGSYTNVTVTNCDTAGGNDCILKRGSDATIGINFNIDKDVNRVDAVVHGIIAGAEIPFPLGQPDGCLKSGLSCPLQKANGPFAYASTLSVLRLYPKVKVTVKWELRDENNQDIVCILIPSQLQ